jgi:hypothetical protein
MFKQQRTSINEILPFLAKYTNWKIWSEIEIVKLSEELKETSVNISETASLDQ